MLSVSYVVFDIQALYAKYHYAEYSYAECCLNGSTSFGQKPFDRQTFGRQTLDQTATLTAESTMCRPNVNRPQTSWNHLNS